MVFAGEFEKVFFSGDISSHIVPKGLNEVTVSLLSVVQTVSIPLAPQPIS